jgi:hypothetical protein
MPIILGIFFIKNLVKETINCNNTLTCGYLLNHFHLNVCIVDY